MTYVRRITIFNLEVNRLSLIRKGFGAVFCYPFYLLFKLCLEA
jgi:hypothetical protein